MMTTTRLQIGLTLLCALVAGPLTYTVGSAQTDYYNLDRHRPTRIEDAVATELYAVGVKLAPLRIEQAADGSLSRWMLLPELSYGITPGTSLEVGVPIVARVEGDTGVGAVELSLFHSLNVETTRLPALAVRGDLELPVGSEGSNTVVRSLSVIGTRTTRLARFHLNAKRTLNPPAEDAEGPGHGEGRWLVGIAADRAFALRSFLLIGEVYAVKPDADLLDTRWTASGGVRCQVSPYLTIDGGIGRTIAEEARWQLTIGASMHLGVRALVRGAGQ